MAKADEKSVIHRKAMGARSDFDARVMSPAKALRLALAKAADKLFDLALTVTMVEQQARAHGKLQKDVGDDGLLVLLDGAGGARGALKVDIQVLAALIEVQTMNTVRKVVADPRPVTPTDAAIVSPLVNAMLDGFDEQLKAAAPEYEKQAFRFGDMFEDARTMAMALEAPEYDVYRLTLDIEEGAKTGVLTLILPQLAKIMPDNKAAKSGAAGDIKLEKSALEAPVALDTVLARISLPLKKICELAPGMQLPIDGESLKRAELVASGGQVIAKVRMGQVNGWRAVRLDQAGAARADINDGLDSRKSRTPAPSAELPEGYDDVLDGLAELVPSGSEAADLQGNDAESEAPGADDLPEPHAQADPGEAIDPADLMLAANPVKEPSETSLHEDA